ncbi:uncharacterized protein LOC116844637 isoform X1 [Odontomachus brunneus]|uniref:uncharacterized protein LOC116844637 isoform X1 n=1 Tax=Odontomachus brunneus TaxID=486640 RepID=UPI0013F23702|nr:uncharacterized protein LOC116844637 isoform X1 [Odontomachus brunneus]
MSCKLIILFLCFEVFVLYVKPDRIYQNETLFLRTSRKDESAFGTFVLLNPKQIQRMEATIKGFLAKLIGPVTITLRLSSPNGDSLQKTISEICETIRAKIMEFARACGLVASTRQREQIPWNSTISEDWFTEGLLQGSLLLCDLVKVGEEMWLMINHYFDTNNATLQKNKESLSREATRSFRFLSTINDASRFNEKFFKCLLPITNGKHYQRASSFDFNRAFANLVKVPPDNVAQTLKTGLDRAFVRYAPSNETSGKQLHALLCHSLTEESSNYDKCVKELRRVEACMSSIRRGSNRIMVNHTLSIKPWLTAIEDLSSCKIYIDADRSANVRCNFGRRVPRTTVQRVKYIYENILDRRISRRSPLHHAANELGNVLSRRRWGRQLTYDVCQYFEIYREGRKRLNKISRQALNNSKVVIRYKKIHHSLNLYKIGVLKKTMLAIGNFHRSALETQRFIIRGIENSFKETWQYHIKILESLFEYMTKLMELFGYTELNDTDVDMSIPTNVPLINMTDSASRETSDYSHDNNRKIIHLVIHRKKYYIRKETDDAFERLVQAMNHVSSVRSGNSKNTLACLANNLLLVTMFMETVSFISTLFCLQKPKNESEFEESKEDWVSAGRDRRSIFFTDFADMNEIKQDSSMIFGVPQRKYHKYL